MLLYSMPDLKWTVTVKPWKWIYTFSRNGTVSWRDPFNGMTGKGSWNIQGAKMITTWVNSTTKEEWDVPFDPKGATGKCSMKGIERPLAAEALNYYLDPGDVVYTGKKIVDTSVFASVIYRITSGRAARLPGLAGTRATSR